MVVDVCGLSSIGIWTGIGLLVGLIFLAMVMFHAGKDTTWIKHPSLSVLLVTTVLVVWQYLGCQKFMFSQIIPLVLIEAYLLLALIHQRD